jgi:hypothetical protein
VVSVLFFSPPVQAAARSAAMEASERVVRILVSLGSGGAGRGRPRFRRWQETGGTHDAFLVPRRAE